MTTTKYVTGAMVRRDLAATRHELSARRRIAELEAGHAPGCPATGVAEQVYTTRTITCAACGDVLLEETIAGDWREGAWPEEDAGVPDHHHRH